MTPLPKLPGSHTDPSQSGPLLGAGLRPHAELQALAESGAAELAWDASAEEVIAWVSRNFSTGATAVACSMADAVLPALVADQLPGVDVLFLDTGYHFPETYGFLGSSDS